MRTELKQTACQLVQQLHQHRQQPGYAEAVFYTALGFTPDQAAIDRLSEDDADEALIKIRAMVHLVFAINDFGVWRD